MPESGSQNVDEYRLSISAMQRSIRACFQDGLPAARALLTAMPHLLAKLGASYIALHLRLGMQFLTEEQARGDFEPSERLRDFIADVMGDAMARDEARCVRLSSDKSAGVNSSGPAIVAALLYDDDGEQAGAAAVVIPDCSRERAQDVLSAFEGTMGFLSLLINQTQAEDLRERGESTGSVLETASKVADDPTRLAYHMAAHLRNRYQFDQVAIGLVNGQVVDVVSLCGQDQVEERYPGVKLIRGAMEESLDRREAIVYEGSIGIVEDGEIPPDCRLHARWSQDIGGDLVGSVPMIVQGEVLAVASVRQGPGSVVRPKQLEKMVLDLEPFAMLIPLAQKSSRKLRQHVADVAAATMGRFFGERRVRIIATATLLALCVSWLAFGTLAYSVSVPATVEARTERHVSAPRSGVLEAVHVRPGDRVSKGQLLAQIDETQDLLERAELNARVASLQSEADNALAERDALGHRVLAGQVKAAKAALALVEHRIASSQVRAPSAGVVLSGDLRKELGSRVSLGSPLFVLGRSDELRIEMRVPERYAVDVQDVVSSQFALRSDLGASIALKDLQFYPRGESDADGTVVIGEASPSERPDGYMPGLEGMVTLDLGARNAWWCLTHRIRNWLHLTLGI